MSVLTGEDNCAAEGLQPQMYFGGAPILPDEQQTLYQQMQGVYDQIDVVAQSETEPIDAYNPWFSANGQALDGTKFRRF